MTVRPTAAATGRRFGYTDRAEQGSPRRPCCIAVEMSSAYRNRNVPVSAGVERRDGSTGDERERAGAAGGHGAGPGRAVGPGPGGGTAGDQLPAGAACVQAVPRAGGRGANARAAGPGV